MKKRSDIRNSTVWLKNGQNRFEIFKLNEYGVGKRRYDQELHALQCPVHDVEKEAPLPCRRLERRTNVSRFVEKCSVTPVPRSASQSMV